MSAAPPAAVPAAVIEREGAAAASAVSWPSILAGAFAASALGLILLAFGTGIGLAVVSPWSDEGVSATGFGIGAGLYLIIVAVMSSAVGGYLAGRLRVRWTAADPDEVFFRDTAHGLLSWAFATVLGAAVLGGAATHIVAGSAGGATRAVADMGAGGQGSGAAQTIMDSLLRADPSVPRNPAQMEATRGELARLLAPAFGSDTAMTEADRTYAAQIVAARSGISPAEAEQRINLAIVQAKGAADEARKAGIAFSLWLAASLLAGAFAASLAAIEGGGLRDGTWKRT